MLEIISQIATIFIFPTFGYLVLLEKRLTALETTLEILREVKAGRRKNLPDEFIDDALKAIDDAVRILNGLAGWQ